VSGKNGTGNNGTGNNGTNEQVVENETVKYTIKLSVKYMSELQLST